MLDDWSISETCYNKIREILPEGKKILELGSGIGTHRLSEHYGMYSIEHDKRWFGIYNAVYFYAPLKRIRNAGGRWYDPARLRNLPTDYDLILVDGPPSVDAHARDGFRQYYYLFLQDVPIIWDDTHRKRDKNNMLRFCLQYHKQWEIFQSKNSEKTFAVIKP